MKRGHPAAPTGAGRSGLLTVPLVVFLLGLLALGLLGWKVRINESQRRNFARMDVIMDTRVRAATFHLWLEEWLEERDAERAPLVRGEIWHDLELALYFCRTLFEGGKTERNQVVVPLDDAALRARAQAIHGKLREFRSLASARLDDPGASKAGSALDERFDVVFRDFERQISALEGLVEHGEVDNQIRARRITLGAIALWILIIGVATVGLFNHQRRRVRAETALWGAQEALEEANQELEARVRSKTESLRTANAALTQKVVECTQAQEALFHHQEQLRALSSQLTLAEERERRRIATELHDRIGTGLAFAKIKLTSAARPDSAHGPPPGVEEGLELIDRLMEDTRTLTLELSSPLLYELGLEAALGWLVERTQEEHGLTVAYECRGLSRRLPEDLAVLLFQAVRELLANVVKHAGASSVRVTCEQEKDDVRIVVEDDGVGFDAARRVLSPTSGGGFGLFSIRERLGSLGGFVEIDSREGKTQVALVVPHGLADELKRGLGDDSSAPGR